MVKYCIGGFKGVALWFALLFFAQSSWAATSISQFSNGTFCSSSYPTAYQSGSFSITETAFKNNNGFTKGQTSQTLIVGFSGGSFQFNPGVGTVTVSGTEITINSFVITASTITVTITTDATNSIANTISFNNVQVRATAAGAGNIVRTGGTFLIDNRTNKPATTVSWGVLTANTTMAYSSRTTTQTNTTNVFAGTTDNQIIGMEVVVTGTCSSINITSFNMTDASQNPGTNISGAKIYYTGTSNAFATTTLFGSIASSVSGAFTINGTVTLTAAGTYYFWLAYDVPITATSGNTLDAQFTSVVIGGVTQSAGTSNPAGSRTISANIYYSIAGGGWNNATTVWSRTSGGLACLCAPTAGNGLVFVNHAVNQNTGTNYTVNVINIQTGGVLTVSNGNLTTTALNTSGTGSFSITGAAFNISGVTTLSGTGTSSSSINHAFAGNLIIGSGTTFQMTAASGTTLSANGNLTVNGTLALSGNNATLATANTLIAGTGSITGSGTINISDARTISAGSLLTINPIITIANNIVVTNFGSISTTNNITGANTNSTWVNEVNSNLTLNGASNFIFNAGATLTATAVGNIVTYSGSGNQTVKTTTYRNLVLGNAGVKTLGGAATVNNNLTISGTARFDVGANALTVGNGWINNSTNATPYSSTGTTTLSGAAATITGTGTTTFQNLTISGSLTSHPTAGRVRVAGVWTNNGDFNANNADITFAGTTSIAGSSDTDFNNIIVSSGTLTFPASPLEVNIEGNLTINGTLAPSTALLNFTGNGNTQLINGSTATQTLHNLKLDNTGGVLTLQKPVTITNGLTLLDGLINTTSVNSLTLNNSVTVSGGSSTSYVRGPLVHVATGNATKVFPIGKGEYHPVTLNITASGTSNYTAEVMDASANALGHTIPTGIDHVSYIRYWNITQSSPTGFTNATATFTYGASDEVDKPSDLRIVKDNGAGAWVNLGGAGSSFPSGTISCGAFTSFSDFALASVSGSFNPLPVELVRFDAKINGDKVDLTWETATELNNEYFTVERSKDGVDFELVDNLDGAGTTNITQYYRLTDYRPLTGISYYRLKQTDYDGTFEYSKLVMVSFEGNFSFLAYPSTITSYLDFKISGSKNDELLVTIYDLNGAMHFQKVFVLKHENDIIRINQLDFLPKGMYLLKAANSKMMNSQKFFVSN